MRRPHVLSLPLALVCLFACGDDDAVGDTEDTTTSPSTSDTEDATDGEAEDG